MNKKEFIKLCAEKAELTQSDMDKAFIVMFEELKNVVREEGKFSVPDFGTFEARERKERNGLNPKTKEQIVIPASTTLAFKATPKCKEFFNK